MAGGRGAIWTERATVALILACLGGALVLVVRVRVGRAPAETDPAPGRSPTVQAAAPPAELTPTPPPPKKPKTPPPPVEDPTAKAVASLSNQTARELDAAKAADARTVALESARQAAIAETNAWKRRTMLVKNQVATLNAQAESLERGVASIDAERDVLEHERDALKAALTKASRRSGYSVLPYRGENGTWRRPIVLECADGGARLLPKGASFNTLDLSPRIHPRSSPIVRAVAHELLHVRSAETPDGAPAVPYLVFLVRPNGIRSYYEARASLEPLGIAFGYELVEQRLEVDVPDYDDLSVWDGSVALEPPLESSSRPPLAAGARVKPSLPAARSRSIESNRVMDPVLASGERLARSGNGDSPDAFTWPNHSGSADRAGSKSASNPWDEVLKPAPGGGSSGGGVLPDLEPAGQAGGMAGGGGFPQSGGTSPALTGAAGAITPGMLGGGSGAAGSPPPRLFGGSGNESIPAPRPFGGPDRTAAGGMSRESPPVSGGGNAEDLALSGGTLGNPSRSSGVRSGMDAVKADGGSAADAHAAIGSQGGEDVAPAMGSLGNPPPSGAAGAAAGTPADAQTAGGPSRGATQQTDPSGGGSTATGAAPAGMIGVSSPTDGAPAAPPPLQSSANQDLSASSSSAGQPSSMISPRGSGSSSSSSASSSSSNSSSTSGGMPLSSVGVGGAGDPSSSRKDDFAPPPLARPDQPQTAIDMPFEITVVCRRKSILIHPGAYVISGDRLHDRAPTGEGALVNELRTIVKKRAYVDPLIHLKPSLKFLVETQGSETFWEARRQLIFMLPDWPMSFKIAGPQERPAVAAEAP